MKLPTYVHLESNVNTKNYQEERNGTVDKTNMCVINKQSILGVQSTIVLAEMRQIIQKDVSAFHNNAPPASLRWCVFYYPLEYMK